LHFLGWAVSGVQTVARETKNIESKKRRNWGETVSSRFYLVVAIATKRYGDQADAFLWLFS